MSAFSPLDHAMMRRALALAEKGMFTATPNPRVGCVLAHGERIVGEGWHEKAGLPHAEVNALVQASAEARGSTVYVSLEPCNHHGKTPPCAEALVKAGVVRVVAAMRDPNTKSKSGGDALRAAGIPFESGLLEEEARELNIGFVSRMTRGRPFILWPRAAAHRSSCTGAELQALHDPGAVQSCRLFTVLAPFRAAGSSLPRTPRSRTCRPRGRARTACSRRTGLPR